MTSQSGYIDANHWFFGDFIYMITFYIPFNWRQVINTIFKHQSKPIINRNWIKQTGQPVQTYNKLNDIYKITKYLKSMLLISSFVQNHEMMRRYSCAANTFILSGAPI